MKLEKKYGLLTAICLVVGTVIGSGVFYKAQDILNKTEGNLTLGILAWIIGGLVMIACACTFGVLATKYEKVNGVVDYAEVMVGKKYAYFMGWFVAIIYIPSISSVLSWVSARYFGELFGWSLTSTNVMVLGGLFMILSYALNALAPKIAGKFQVSATFIKLVPIILIAVVGTVYGLVKTIVSYEVTQVLVDGELVNVVVKTGSTQMQILIENFKHVGGSGAKLLLGSVVMTAFAYEGWIIATSINAELKNSKRNLPLALFFGSLIIVVLYIAYYIGVAGGATIDVLQTGGAPYAFKQIFGDVFGTILTVFVVISCLGTLNGLMLSVTRGLYALASRNLGPRPDVFKQIDEKTNMPHNSAIIGLIVSMAWYVFFYGSVVTGIAGAPTWFGKFSFDSSELPLVTTYAMYCPIFVMMIVKKRKEFGVFKGIILPIFAIISCAFMTFAAIYSHEWACLYYFIIFVILMGIGGLFFLLNKKNEKYDTVKEEIEHQLNV